jgi:PAS domain-containing protein
VVDNRVAYFNPQVTEMTGWCPEDVIGQTPEEFVDEQSAKDLLQGQERLLSGQCTVTINACAPRWKPASRWWNCRRLTNTDNRLLNINGGAINSFTHLCSRFEHGRL